VCVCVCDRIGLELVKLREDASRNVYDRRRCVIRCGQWRQEGSASNMAKLFGSVDKITKPWLGVTSCSVSGDSLYRVRTRKDILLSDFRAS
jgi:hypothetical protein